MNIKKSIINRLFSTHAMVVSILLPTMFICLQSTAQAPVKTLVWSDEFNYTGLPDSSKWNYDTGTGCPELCGWGNNEKQFYTKNKLENAAVKNGHLIITARKEQLNGSTYSSARLTTKGKGDWTYGRIEARAKLPEGRGIWSAIWMLPTNPAYGGWPKSGEIDIMENVGYQADSVYGTIHSGAYNGMIGTQKSKGLRFNDLSKTFHVYAVEWTAEKISFFVDDQLYNEFINQHNGKESWPFDQPFHVLLNIAVGGNWGGKMGIDDTVFPQKMEIDYVRIYQWVKEALR